MHGKPAEQGRRIAHHPEAVGRHARLCKSHTVQRWWASIKTAPTSTGCTKKPQAGRCPLTTPACASPAALHRPPAAAQGCPGAPVACPTAAAGGGLRGGRAAATAGVKSAGNVLPSAANPQVATDASICKGIAGNAGGTAKHGGKRSLLPTTRLAGPTSHALPSCAPAAISTSSASANRMWTGSAQSCADVGPRA